MSTMVQSNDNSRRDFLRESTVLGAGAVLAGSNTLSAEPSLTKGDGPYPTEGMAGYSETGPLKPLKFGRRALGPKDVAIKILFCGVCHSDIHTIHGDWGKINYPQIVGHELAGEIVAVGSSVSRFDVGSRVGVGTMVDSCRHCPECLRGSENYCENGNTQTYGSKDRDGSITQGGYSTFIVVDEGFVLSVPPKSWSGAGVPKTVRTPPGLLAETQPLCSWICPMPKTCGASAKRSWTHMVRSTFL